MKRRRAGWLAVAAAVGLLTQGGATASPRDALRTCSTAQLRIGLIHTGAALGTVGGYIAFRNRSRTSCRLRGWPTLVAVRADGTTSAARRRRSTMFGPSPAIRGLPAVTLRPGQRGDAVFTAGDNPGPGRLRCPPPYRQLRITPPGNTQSTLVSAWLPGFGHFLPSCAPIELSFVVAASALDRG